MNNFGLGLVLSFTDNASTGMQRATRTFEDLNNATSNFSLANDVDSALMSISYAAGVVGDELFQVGQNITSLFTSVISNVTQTGTAIATARTQLSTLYGSEDAGVQKLAEIKEYAKSSIFNFEDLIPSVIMLKANGIEAFDKIASSAYLAGDATSQANQTLMDYAADLAAFNPQMRNSYGTGIQAAMGALNEYIAEGNAMSLKRGASLDINSLIGEETADTIEERSRQVADLIEKLGMVGMTANLANTPMQRLSNVSDIFFNLMSDVSDSGVFEKYSSLIAKFTDYLFKIPDEELKNIAEVIGGALTDLMTPFEKLIDVGIKVVDWIRDLVKTRPELVQTAIKAIAVAGAFLLISGVVLKLGSSLGFLRISLSGLFKGGITNGTGVLGLIINLTRYIFPLISAVTLLKLAWDRNFLGIKDTTTETLTKVWETFKLVVEAFRDNKLSEESFKKAQEMGVLPLIEGILQLKYHWGFFVEGFKKGLDAFFNSLGEVLVRLGILKVNVSGFKDFIVKVIDAMTAPGMIDTWERFGEVIGKASGKLMLVFVSIGLVRKALGLLGGVSSGLSTLSRLPLIGTLFGGNGRNPGGNNGPFSGGILTHPTAVLKSLLSATIIVGGVIGLIEVLGVLEKTPGFNKYLSSGLSVMSTLFENLASIVIDIVALSLAIKLLDLVKLSPGKSLKGIADLAIILVGFTAIVGIVGALASIPMVSYFITSGAKTLSNLFTAMEVFTTPEFLLATVAISALGYVTPATVASGVAGLAILIGGIGLIVAAFGALSLIDGFDEFMKSGGKSLANLFEIIGEICGSFVSGIAVGLTNGLPEIGSNIAQFGENIKPFFDAVKDVPVDSVAKFLVAFGEFVLMLSAEELLSFITGGIDLPAIGSELSSFGQNAKTFFDIVSQYSEDGMNKAARVFDVLAGMGNSAFKIGGIAAVISGETNLAVIGLELSSFAPNAKTFFDTVAQYPEEGINKAPRVFEALGGMGDSAFKIGGLSAVISGETALNVIGMELASFAPNAKIFFDTVAQYSDDGIAKAPIVFEALAGMGNSAFKIGGMAAIISGETALSIIGYELASFAPNGATFFNAVAGYSDEGIEKTPDVFKCLEGMGDSAFKIGGIAALISGETALNVIGYELASFAPNMKTFVDTAGELSDNSLDKAERVLNFLTVIGESGVNVGGIQSWFNGDIDLEEMGEQLTDYAEELEDFFDIVGFFNDDDIDNGMRCIDMLRILGEADIREGGVLGAIRGGFKLADLGSQLAGFGPGVKTYFDSVKDLDDGSFERGNKAIQTLTALNDATFKSGGLLQAINGGSVDIGNLATNLGDFGTNSKTFFTSVRDLKYEDFAKATKLFEALGTMDTFSDVVISLGPNTLSSFGKELVTFVEDLTTFLEKSSGFDTSGFTLTESLEPFFKAIDDFDSNQLLDISSGLDNVSKSSSDFSIVLETVAIEVKDNSKSILTAIEDCVSNSLTALNNLSSRGENIGYNLMVSLANGITANAYMITNAVQSAVDSVNVSIPNIASNTASRVYGPQKMVGLATGGYVNTTGVAVLHPNEVVVNDHITQELKSFLSDYKSGNTLKGQSIVNQTIVTNSTQESYSNQFNSNTMDDSNIISTLNKLNGTLGTMSDSIRISALNTLGLNSKPTSIVNNSTFNENTTKLDEVKTVEVLTEVLNIITEKSNSIVGLMKNISPLRYDTGNTKLVSTIKGLVESIGDYDKQYFNSSPLIRQDIVADDNYSEKPETITVETPPGDNKDNDRPVENSPMQTLVENNTVLNNNNRVENNRSDSSSSSDNRVIFNSGSITIKVDSNGGKISKEELNNCADELMKIIGRKMQLRGMQTRK